GYWFAPRGPVLGSPSDKRKIFSLFLKLLSVGTIHELPLLAGPSLFDRFEPFIEEDQVLIQEMMRTGLRHRHAINPSTTLLVDLMKTENELLAQMHPKTRYNIRVADKHGVTVREARREEDIEIFLRLLQETAERDQFMPQPAKYLRALWEALLPSGMIRLHFAERNGEVLAAHMNVIYGDTMTYLHGASSSTHREMMAPYALHWAVMSEAKRQGYRYYDFWGCNPSNKNHFDYKTTWEGMTRFKEGWGGQKISLVGTWDLPRHSFLYKWVIQ
ncbi:MAG: peptidoglycan bridge formation glycyltransferase FemA/FemB family protein, partial [Candidatus Uhrbacteria bacterium]|nr:peptidoglycan bridge formation glycyltransferase FemA/FemB family protein [Candidatus Uhrbacteria bacterium]